MYHDVFSESPAPFIPRTSAMYHISKQSFIQHLEIIRKSTLNVVGISENLDNNNKNSISISFDDGWEGSFTIAIPILKEFGYRCTYFITKDFIGREGFIDEKGIIWLPNQVWK